MPLDSLLSLVEKLRERIDNHRDDLSKNETLTRYALIDPLLRELGWDTEDPALVMPECKVSDKSKDRVDYALLGNGNTIMVIEAKSLGTPLKEALAKAFNYRQKMDARYFSVTDGQHWEIHDYKPFSGDEKKTVQIVEFDLRDRLAVDVCEKALSRSKVDVGRSPSVGLTPNRPRSGLKNTGGAG